MHNPRFHHFRQFRSSLALLCATLLLAGCNGSLPGNNVTPGSASSQGVAPAGLTPHSEEWRVTVRNRTDHYVWLTRYWSHRLNASWHVEGANCIAPHGEITEAVYFTDILAGPQVKLRAEIKPQNPGRTNCANDANWFDVSGRSCDIKANKTHVTRGEAFVEYLPSNYTYDVRTTCDVTRP